LEAPQAQSVKLKGTSKTGSPNIEDEKGTENYSPGVYNGAHKDFILTPDS